MINNTLTLSGTLEIFRNGQPVQTVKNLIVSAGKEWVANRLKADTQAAIGWMAVGTDGTSASASDTALLAEVARVALTSSTVTANAVAFTANYPAGTGTGTLLEAGLFNASSSGTMLSRTASINVVKGATDTLTIVWTVTVN